MSESTEVPKKGDRVTLYYAVNGAEPRSCSARVANARKAGGVDLLDLEPEERGVGLRMSVRRRASSLRLPCWSPIEVEPEPTKADGGAEGDGDGSNSDGGGDPNPTADGDSTPSDDGSSQGGEGEGSGDAGDESELFRESKTAPPKRGGKK